MLIKSYLQHPGDIRGHWRHVETIKIEGSGATRPEKVTPSDRELFRMAYHTKREELMNGSSQCPSAFMSLLFVGSDIVDSITWRSQQMLLDNL